LHQGQEIHLGQCQVVVGPKGGRRSQVEIWRVNGQVKTWSTIPCRFSVPIKRGLRDYGYLTNVNGRSFHLAGDCQPVEVDPYGTPLKETPP